MKTQETKTFTVGGEEVEYIFTQMVPEVATRVAVRILKIAGLQAGGAIGALQLKEGGLQASKDMELDMQLLGDAIGKMFTQVNEDETIDTFKKLLNSVLFNAKPLNMNHPNFQGNTLHLMAVVMEAGRVNFSDFFDASSGVLGVLKARIAETLNRVTSSGPTGDLSSAG